MTTSYQRERAYLAAIGLALRRRRTWMRLSLRDVAERSDCSLQNVSEAELAKRELRLTTLRRYAIALNTTGDEILREAEEILQEQARRAG